MSLETSLNKLCNDLRQFREILQGVEMTVTQDRPETETVVLVHEVSDDVTEIDSLCQESLEYAEAALHAAAHDANRVRQSLDRSQHQYLAFSRIMASRLLSYEKVAALVRFGHDHGRGWMAWVTSLRRGLELCRPGADALGDTYLQCWVEMAERTTFGPVSLHTTNIGQQITAEALEVSRSPHDGAT